MGETTTALPVEKFNVNRGFFCILREEDANQNELLPSNIGANFLSTSISLICEPVDIPGAPNNEPPEITLNLMLPFNDIRELANCVIEYSEAEQIGNFAQGSMFFLDAHQDVKCSEIRFCSAAEDRIQVELDLTLDILYEGNVILMPQTFICELELEPQW